jgi:hypothetical protein
MNLKLPNIDRFVEKTIGIDEYQETAHRRGILAASLNRNDVLPSSAKTKASFHYTLINISHGCPVGTGFTSQTTFKSLERT